jgi:hypothetical protein
MHLFDLLRRLEYDSHETSFQVSGFRDQQASLRDEVIN